AQIPTLLWRCSTAFGLPVVPDVITQNAGSPSWRRTGASGVAGIAFQACSSRSRQISLVFGEEAATAPAVTLANSASTTTAAGRTIARICASSASLARLDIATAIAPRRDGGR